MNDHNSELTKQIYGVGMPLGYLIFSYLPKSKNEISEIGGTISNKIRSCYSFSATFFGGKEIDTRETLLVNAMNQFAELSDKMNDEIDEWWIKIVEKQQEEYDQNAEVFNQSVAIKISDYPELSKDVYLASEVEKAIGALTAHHDELKTSIANYLASSFEDDNIKTHNKNLEM